MNHTTFIRFLFLIIFNRVICHVKFVWDLSPRITEDLKNKKKKILTFLSNVTTFSVAFLGGTTNTANGVNVLRREALLIVENQQCCRRSRGCNVLWNYYELKRRIHPFLVIIIFRILPSAKQNSPVQISNLISGVRSDIEKDISSYFNFQLTLSKYHLNLIF